MQRKIRKLANKANFKMQQRVKNVLEIIKISEYKIIAIIKSGENLKRNQKIIQKEQNH